MEEKEIEEIKSRIDAMTQIEMARHWRFAPSDDPIFRRDLPLYRHFMKRFKELGGLTSEISKRIGW